MGKVNNGTSKYTVLPVMKVNVNNNQATVNVPSAVTCSQGGKSVPMIVTASAIPFSDIKVSLTTSATNDGGKVVTLSRYITPNTNIVTLKVGTSSGVLGFACAGDPTEHYGKELKYVLDGTDKAMFALSSTVVAVTAAKAGTKPASPKLTLTMDAAKSEASKTVV